MPSKCVAGETVPQEEQGGELPPVQHGSAALKSLSEETTAGTAWDFLCGAIDTSRIWGIDPLRFRSVTGLQSDDFVRFWISVLWFLQDLLPHFLHYPAANLSVTRSWR